MPITFKNKDSHGYSILPLFGVDQNLINEAKKNKVEVSITPPDKYSIKAAGKFIGQVIIKGSAMTMAKNGTLGPSSYHAFKTQFTEFLQKALAEVLVDELVDKLTYDPTAPLSFDPALEPSVAGFASVTVDEHGNKVLNFQAIDKPELTAPKLTAGQKAALTKAKKLSSPVQQPQAAYTPNAPKTTAGVAALIKSPPVPLALAESVYKSTFGTNATSVYHVLARWTGLNMAVRIVGNKLSFRAEGNMLNSHKVALQDLGFKVKPAYASAHFECPSFELALKTSGAVVGRVGLSNVIQVADLQIIKEYSA